MMRRTTRAWVRTHLLDHAARRRAVPGDAVDYGQAGERRRRRPATGARRAHPGALQPTSSPRTAMTPAPTDGSVVSSSSSPPSAPDSPTCGRRWRSQRRCLRARTPRRSRRTPPSRRWTVPQMPSAVRWARSITSSKGGSKSGWTRRAPSRSVSHEEPSTAIQRSRSRRSGAERSRIVHSKMPKVGGWAPPAG